MPYKDQGRQREAQREYAARRREREPQQVEALRRSARATVRARNRQIILEFKATGCARCPEDDPAALDCHHVGPKSFAIGKRTTADLSAARLRAELAKCEVLCANCHRKEHFSRR